MKNEPKRLPPKLVDKFKDVVKFDKYGLVIDMQDNCAQIAVDYAEDEKPKLLLDFFMWFRENGEFHIGKSMEKMIDVYLKKHEYGKQEIR